MFQTFQPLLTTQKRQDVNESFEFYTFANFDILMNESYLDIEITNRQGRELLIESSGCSNEIREIINEGVIGTLLEKVSSFIKAIIEFIRGLINKINLFADSMTKNINKWVVKVAPTALEKSKSAKYLSGLTGEGYYWDESYISTGLISLLGKVMDYSATVSQLTLTSNGKVEMVTAESSSSPKKTAEQVKKKTSIIKQLFSFEKKVSDKIKTEEANKKETKEPEQKPDTKSDEKNKEFSVDIPEVKPEEDTKNNTNNTDTKVTENSYKEAIAKFLKETFNSDKANYRNIIIKKAHKGSAEPIGLSKYSSSMIAGHIEFIKKAPELIKAITERYTDLLNEYNELESALTQMDRGQTSSNELSKYQNIVMGEIKSNISFVKEATSINNTIANVNISLVEECTKQYMRVCNKLALSGGEKSNAKT